MVKNDFKQASTQKSEIINISALTKREIFLSILTNCKWWFNKKALSLPEACSCQNIFAYKFISRMSETSSENINSLININSCPASTPVAINIVLCREHHLSRRKKFMHDIGNFNQTKCREFQLFYVLRGTRWCFFLMAALVSKLFCMQLARIDV